MVDTLKLKGVIVQNGKTQEDVANHLGIAPKTFYSKMKKRVFGSDEIESMIDYLKIEDPVSIFFAKEVT
jgi:DNA-binding XRE family transcriptional regulator